MGEESDAVDREGEGFELTIAWITEGAEVLRNLVKNCRIFNRRWDSIVNTVSNLLDRAAHDLAGPSLGQAIDDSRHLE